MCQGEIEREQGSRNVQHWFFSSIETDNSLTYTFGAHKCLKTSS